MYEELYEDQYGDKIISPPILEILVNKRIFNLVRPLWISRLSINSSQLDKRLAELLNDSLRLVSLRRLHLQFHETLAHLIGMTVSRLTSLAQLTVDLPASTPPWSQSILIGGIEAPTSLTALSLHVQEEDPGPEVNMMDAFFEEKLGNRLQRFEISGGGDYFSRRLRTQQGTIARYFCNSNKSNDFEISVEEWSTLQSFESYDTYETPEIEEALACLERVFTRNLVSPIQNLSLWIPLTFESIAAKEQTGTVALIHLALPVLFYDPEDRTDSGYFTQENFTTLFRLLSFTKVERLELKSLTWIPPVSQQHPVPSIRLLRLSGPCKLASEVEFFSLARLSFWLEADFARGAPTEQL